MNPVIIVEGPTDQKIIEHLLPRSVREIVTIILGGSRSNIQSLARSILTSKKRPVVLIYDADTTSESAINEQREFSNWYLTQGTVGTPFHTIVAVPTIEVIFFQDRAMLANLLGHNFSDMEWELAKSQPEKVLKGFADNYLEFLEELLQKLTPTDIETLASHPIMQELIDFLSGITVDIES